jgi:hypothetical protein
MLRDDLDVVSTADRRNVFTNDDEPTIDLAAMVGPYRVEL